MQESRDIPCTVRDGHDFDVDLFNSIEYEIGAQRPEENWVVCQVVPAMPHSWEKAKDSKASKSF